MAKMKGVGIRNSLEYNKAVFGEDEVKIEFIRENKSKIDYTGFEENHHMLQVIIKGWWTKVLELLELENGKFEVITPIKAGKGILETIISW